MKTMILIMLEVKMIKKERVDKVNARKKKDDDEGQSGDGGP